MSIKSPKLYTEIANRRSHKFVYFNVAVTNSRIMLYNSTLSSGNVHDDISGSTDFNWVSSKKQNR